MYSTVVLAESVAVRIVSDRIPRDRNYPDLPYPDGRKTSNSPFRSCFRRCQWDNPPKPPSQCVPWSGRECLGTPSAAWDSVQRRSLQPNSRWGPAKAAGERYISPWDPDDLASTNFQASFRRLNNKGQVSNNLWYWRELPHYISRIRYYVISCSFIFSSEGLRLTMTLAGQSLCQINKCHTNLANLSRATLKVGAGNENWEMGKWRQQRHWTVSDTVGEL